MGYARAPPLSELQHAEVLLRTHRSRPAADHDHGLPEPGKWNWPAKSPSQLRFTEVNIDVIKQKYGVALDEVFGD